MYNQPNTPKPAQSFGSVQETFRYRMRNFNPGEEFTIVEDMPKTKPIRFEAGQGKTKDGRTFDSKTYLIRVTSRGYEADIEMYEKELMSVATLCPKGMANFKGTTFVYNGTSWAYMGIADVSQPISSISQSMRDPRQPDLSAPQVTPQPDQKDVFVNKLIDGIKAINSIGTDVLASDVLKMASKIYPGHEVELVGYAKAKGLMHEADGGVYKVS